MRLTLDEYKQRVRRWVKFIDHAKVPILADLTEANMDTIAKLAYDGKINGFWNGLPHVHPDGERFLAQLEAPHATKH